MQTFYNNLIRETQNWEDFVLEGGAGSGCCNVYRGDYEGPGACNGACNGACPSPVAPNLKPPGCTISVRTQKNKCCISCCNALLPTAPTFAVSFCSGKKAFPQLCFFGKTFNDKFGIKIHCRKTPGWTIGTTTLPNGRKYRHLNTSCTP